MYDFHWSANPRVGWKNQVEIQFSMAYLSQIQKMATRLYDIVWT